ncbi:hypothetical protein GUITHDRAFT_155501 [Guillardia theta CCMP2712]|uniref:PDZ domain-containing protein n=1 Tax=Guillardia theta (strain CCMP2712) TaxID=905079 RepID=L1IHJ3_GUITC|nr:hypothetical protein GUITHDRAFT_155501 [Guillardia theta CCMP2712]EKX35389.1 hypothetical protein GUITHDRAFT_155501 [Guillardia theta CCMP2712]|eukprot:XP_005822369.1 hypothetical protein GUITHDRAFT_155501 [Guillardia theta CCMP2712]
MGEAQSCLACDSKRNAKPADVRKAVPDEKSSLVSIPAGEYRTSSVDSGSTSSSKFLEKAKVGIGAYFQRSKEEEDMLQVKSLLKGSPAQLCNKISIGDRIIAVNGESVHGRSLAELAEKLLGPTGSVVECTFKSVKSNEIFSVTLVRGINADRWNQR